MIRVHWLDVLRLNRKDLAYIRRNSYKNRLFYAAYVRNTRKVRKILRSLTKPYATSGWLFYSSLKGATKEE